MNELVFHVNQEEDGGFSAAAVEHLIFTQGDSREDLRAYAEEAAEAHFFQDPSKKPMRLHLQLT